MTTTGKPARFEKKVCHPSELAERAQRLKGPVVFTNGVFDLLHRGHVTYLDQAAQEGQPGEKPGCSKGCGASDQAREARRQAEAKGPALTNLGA